MSETQNLEAVALGGAETAVGDLLARLRLQTGTHEVTTVLDWLDQHGVLDAVDHAASHPTVSDTAPVSDAPPAEVVPAAEVPGAGGAAVVDAGLPSAPVHSAQVEPTASAAAAAADAEATDAALGGVVLPESTDVPPPAPTDLRQRLGAILTELSDIARQMLDS